MTDAILVALIAAVPATIGAVAGIGALIVSVRGNKKVDSIKVEIDGRLSQLLASVGTEQHAVGHAAGVEEERNRRP